LVKALDKRAKPVRLVVGNRADRNPFGSNGDCGARQDDRASRRLVGNEGVITVEEKQ